MEHVQSFMGRDGREVRIGDAVTGTSHFGFRVRGTVERIVIGRRTNAFVRRPESENLFVVDAACLGLS